MKRLLLGMAMFESKVNTAPIIAAIISDSLLSSEAKTHASTAALYRNPSARGQSTPTYYLPVDLLQISSSLKIDEPFTPMRNGQLSMFIETVDPLPE